jgi:hypothetical protein
MGAVRVAGQRVIVEFHACSFSIVYVEVCTMAAVMGITAGDKKLFHLLE